MSKKIGKQPLLKLKSATCIQQEYKIPRPARPGPSPAHARGSAVPVRPVRGPGLGPGLGRAGLGILHLSWIYLGYILVYAWVYFRVYLWSCIWSWNVGTSSQELP